MTGSGVDVRLAAGEIYISATTLPQGRIGVTVATRAEWDAFVVAVKAGAFDDLEES